MKGKVKVLKNALLTMFILAISAFGINSIKQPNADAAVIRPYPSNTMGLTVDYDSTDKELDITVTGGTAGYSYQYWLKTKVSTDNSGNLDEQYIWQMVKGYAESSSSESIPVTDNNLDEDDRYNVIVRVKNGVVIEELYGAYTLSDLGVPVISLIMVNEIAVYESNVIINKNEPVTLEIFSNIAVDYALYYGEGKTPIGTAVNGFSGEISLDLSSSNYKTGLHTFRAEITNGTVKDVKYFTVYAYSDYKSNEMPVITSLSGTDNGSGISTFVMKVQFADGISIKDSEKENFTYTLKSGPFDGVIKSKTVNADGQTLDVVFEVNYKVYGKDNKGIYETIGKVIRTGANAGDDKVIIYYTGYSQGGSLNQTSETSGDTIIITANGSINNVAASDYEYAFYREDASGWVLIRDYQTSTDNPGAYNKLVWTPKRGGTYNIQVRIKDKNSVTWEKAVTKSYTVAGSGLTGTVSVNIYDYATGDPVTSGYKAGKPYKIEAVYEEEIEGNKVRIDDVLYMFTLKNNNLGTIYLNNFSPNPCYMFIPNKADIFEITARVINKNSFGFKDKAINVDVKSETEFNFFAENRVDVWNVGGNGYFTYYQSSNRLAFAAEAGSSITNSTARLDSFVINKALDDGYNAIKFRLYLSTGSPATTAEFRPILINGGTYTSIKNNIGINYYTDLSPGVSKDVIVKITDNGEYVNGTNQFGIMLGASASSTAMITDIKFINYEFTETFDNMNFAISPSKYWSIQSPGYFWDAGGGVIRFDIQDGSYSWALGPTTLVLDSSIINTAIALGYDTLSFKAVGHVSQTLLEPIKLFKTGGDTRFEYIVDDNNNNYSTLISVGTEKEFNVKITNNGPYGGENGDFGIRKTEPSARISLIDIYFTKSGG